MEAAGDIVPSPDPTRLTTAQLLAEIAHVRELLETKLDGHIDSASEKFAAVDERFLDRDRLFAERADAQKAAVATALTSARELVEARNIATQAAADKFEKSVGLQIAQLESLLGSYRSQLDEKITGLKERMDRGEGATSGASGQRTESRLNVNTIFQVIAVLIAAAVLYAAFHK